MFGGVFGGESDAEADGSDEAVTGSDALAVALAADHAKQDDRVARAAAEFLKAQTDALNEQRALRLSHMHSQSREGELRRLGQRLRIGSQVVFVLIVAAVGLGLLVMLLDAFNARSVIVEPFDAPPALAARGLTGKVVAGGVLDALTRLQASTRGSVAQRHLANAWTSDIKVEVPETGVSVSDVVRTLKARFGHDIHIDGDLVQTEAGGLNLTIRGDGVLPKTFAGAAGDLDKLTTQAAEYVYGQSEPALYEVYLSNAGRNADAVAFAKSAFAAAKPEDAPYVLNAWANALSNIGGSQREALALYRQALQLKPDYWVAYNNVMNSEWILGDEEGAWKTGEAMRKAAGGRPGRANELYYQNPDIMVGNLQAVRASELADEALHAGVGTGTAADAPGVAEVDVRLHDPADAETQLRTAQGDATDPTIAAIIHFIHGRLASEAGDTQRAALEMEAFGAAYLNPIVSSNYPGYTCWIAPAEEAAGHPDKADAALKAGGHYVDCYRFRGDILDHRGDWVGAQSAYAQAVAIAPDLPAGYYSWGVALALHGDLAGAIAKLGLANRHGPNWADPLKAWGDVLARQGRCSDALAKYEAALKLAPAWQALRQARDAAARRAG